MRDGQTFSARLNNVVTTEREFDELVTKSLPELLDRATGQTKRFLRETNQWGDDITHEKLALRWGYELVERFVVFGRTEVPCRPFFLLDSLIAKSFSQPDPLCYHKELLTPVGRFLDGLASRAVVSGDHASGALPRGYSCRAPQTRTKTGSTSTPEVPRHR